MKLGFVTTSFPRHRGDFAGHFVASMVELARQRGHTVEVIAAGSPTCPREERRTRGLAPTALGGETSAPSLRVTRLPSALFFRGGAPDALGPRTVPSALAFSARLVATTWARAPRWEAAVAHWLAPSALAALPVRGPLLAVAHGGDLHLLRKAGLLPAALGVLLARRARLAFVSAELAALARAELPTWLKAAFDERTLVQPMGIDLAHLAGAQRRSERPLPSRYALVLARLVPQKGVELAVRALAHLPSELTLVIAGEGPERERLEQVARPLGARVRFVGQLDAPARDAFLSHADLLLMPSRRLADGRAEGTPLAALEALACGVPVLASPVGGLAELAPAVAAVAGDTGELDAVAAPELAQRWAAAIEAMLGSPPAADGLRAAAARHDWHRVHAALWSHWMGQETSPDTLPRALLTTSSAQLVTQLPQS